MFGPDWIQESVALAIVAGALIALFLRLSGKSFWPRRNKPTPKVELGGRLARGLKKASHRH